MVLNVIPLVNNFTYIHQMFILDIDRGLTFDDLISALTPLISDSFVMVDYEP